MNKKILIIILTAIVILAVAGTTFYFFYLKNQTSRVAKSELFTLKDKDVIWEENLNLAPEIKAAWEARAAEAEANIAKGGDSDWLYANYGNLALFKSYLGNYKEAYDLYLKAVELQPKSRVPWMALGDLLIKMEAYQGAEEAFQKAIETNQYEPLAYVKLADLYRLNKEPEEKIQVLYDKAMTNMVDDTVLLDSYAGWLKAKGDKAKAIEVYEQLKKLQPQNKEALNREIEKLK